MNKENLSDALNYIDDGMLKNASEAEAKRLRPSKTAVIAASLAAVIALGTGAAAAVGGHFVEFKNIFGTVTGGKYVDASDDLSVSFAGFRDGHISADFDIKKPDKAPYSTLKTGASLDLLSYKVTDSSGNVVIDSSDGDFNTVNWSYTDSGEPFAYGTLGDSEASVEYRVEGVEPGSVEIAHYTFDGFDVSSEDGLDEVFEVNIEDLQKTGGKTYSIAPSGDDGDGTIVIRYLDQYEDKDTGEVYYFISSTEQLAAGTYTLTVDSLVMNSKGDQPLEICGSWQDEFEIGDDVSGLFA